MISDEELRTFMKNKAGSEYLAEMLPSSFGGGPIIPLGPEPLAEYAEKERGSTPFGYFEIELTAVV